MSGFPLFTCTICGQGNLNAEDMNTHMLTAHEQTQCPMCDLAGITASELEYHVNTAHNDILSPCGSGHSSRTNGFVTNGRLTSPVKQEHSVRVISGINMPKSRDEESRGKTLLALSKEHAVKNGDVAKDRQTKDATGRKIKNSSKKQSKDGARNPVASINLTYPIPQTQSNSSEDVPEVVSLSSSSSSFSVISVIEAPDDSGYNAVRDDRSSTSSVQSPLKKKVRTSPDTSSDVDDSSDQSNTSFNSIFSAIKNIIQSPFKNENANGEESNGASMQSPQNIPNANVTNNSMYGPLEGEAGASKSVNELKHCPICEYSTTDADSLAYHVDEHFSADTNDDEALAKEISQADEAIKIDEQIARQIENDERMKVEKEEASQFQELQKKYGMNDSGSYKKQAQQAFERALSKGQMTVSDYYNQLQSVNISLNCGIDDGKARTKGLLTKLYQYYCKGVDGVKVVRLCVDTSHYCSSPGDKGWGCGYKNIQMLMTAMCNDSRFKKSVFNGSMNMPSITKIQQLIEKAWSEGYDPQGKEQLGAKVYNTRKWIGATEVVALFTSLKVRCSLLDFHKPTGADRTHLLLFDWIKKYFGSPPPLGNLFSKTAICSNKLPLYLQHEGHSRTVIGYEQLRDKSIRLLLFDPSLSQKQLGLLKASELTGYALKPLRQTLTNLKSKQYQIVCIQGNLTDQESKFNEFEHPMFKFVELEQK